MAPNCLTVSFSHRGDLTLLADVSPDGDGLSARGYDLLHNPRASCAIFLALMTTICALAGEDEGDALANSTT